MRNISVTVTDDAGNSTTTADTTGLTYNNGPTVTFSDYGVDVWFYDVKGDIDINADQFDVRFEETGDVNSIMLLDPNMGEGLGIVISNAAKGRAHHRRPQGRRAVQGILHRLRLPTSPS